MSSWIESLGLGIARAALVFLPALIANAMPLIARKVLKKRKFTPVDFGRSFIDGKRIFGDNKSWEGILAGIAGGCAVGAAFYAYTHNPYWIIYGFLMGSGTMAGDLLNSFIKRRINIRPGDPFVPFDQITFLLASYALVYFSGILPNLEIYPGSQDLLLGLFLVIVLHPIANLFAYLLKIKKTPW